VIDLDAAPDVVGLVTPEHGGTADLEGECYVTIYNCYLTLLVTMQKVIVMPANMLQPRRCCC
jgi:hypothetical protein